MEQALVVAGDPILNAGAFAAGAGICKVGSAIVGLTGAFAAGFAASELKSRICGKRKLDQLEADISEVKEKSRRLETALKVSVVKTRGNFKTQGVVLSQKADVATIAEKLNAKVDANGVEKLIASQVDARFAEKQREESSKTTGQQWADPAETHACASGSSSSAGTAQRSLSGEIVKQEAVSATETSIHSPPAERMEPNEACVVGIHDDTADDSCVDEGPMVKMPFPAMLPSALLPMPSTKLDAAGAYDSKRPRRREAERIRAKYPDRIPVICQAYGAAGPIATVEHKLLVPEGMLGSQLKNVLSKRIKQSVMHLCVDHSPLEIESPVSEVYDRYKAEDGFLRIMYSTECF